jgi:hypothetical protein
MNKLLIILSTGMLFSFLITVAPGLSAAPGNSPNPKTAESPFACNRLALTPEQRKRHFDELGPQLRSLKKSFRELPNGYEFEFPSNPHSIQLVAEWAIGERLLPIFRYRDSHGARRRISLARTNRSRRRKAIYSGRRCRLDQAITVQGSLSYLMIFAVEVNKV